MKQIAVVSGKGGTGKTIISASFVALAGRCAAADCDVDASNLHILLKPKIMTTSGFKGGKKAIIDKKACIKCKKCIIACRFNAISAGYDVDETACEGCGLCFNICPAEAVAMRENTAGEFYMSETAYGPFMHARLGSGEDNSGKLVTKVREEAKKAALNEKLGLIIIDGPPGTGCPVMASITGVDFMVIVTEPTVSGLHDLIRVAELAEHFKIKAGVIVNKYDLNEIKAGEIEAECAGRGIAMLGRVSFSECVLEAVNKAVPPVLYCEAAAKEIRNCWENVKKEMQINQGE